jgi:hypothetical protein
MVKDFSPGGHGMTLTDHLMREIAAGRTITLQEGRDPAKVTRE